MFNEKFYDESTKSRDPEFVKLITRLDKIYNAAAEGVLLQAKTTLPPHYTFYDTVSNKYLSPDLPQCKLVSCKLSYHTW